MGKGSVLENVFVDMLMVRTLDLVSGQVECNLGREKFLESYVAVGIEALKAAFVQNRDEAFLKLESCQCFGKANLVPVFRCILHNCLSM